MTIGERIKELRLKLGYSQVDFADKINVSKQTLYKYENNIVTNIPSDKIEAIARLGNVSPAYLMGWSEIAEKLKPTKSEIESLHQNTYESLVVKEMKKLNQKGKVKLLDTAREMTCNPLYNPNYQIEVAAAHERTDIEVTEEMRQHDDALMDDDNNWE